MASVWVSEKRALLAKGTCTFQGQDLKNGPGERRMMGSWCWGGGLRGEVGGWEEGAGHGANGGLFSNLVPLDFGGFGVP